MIYNLNRQNGVACLSKIRHMSKIALVLDGKLNWNKCLIGDIQTTEKANKPFKAKGLLESS